MMVPGQWMSKSDGMCDYDIRNDKRTTRPLLWTNSLPRKTRKNPGEFGFYEKTESCYVRVFEYSSNYLRARAALESSSKRGSFQRIFNCQEFWSIEMGHLTYNMGIWWRRF